MAAKNPKTGKTMYFFNKCLPFGSIISCSHFQRFSNALRHLLKFRCGKKNFVINYLDDFLFITIYEEECNEITETFLQLYEELGVPVALEKTEWASARMVFLGILIDGINACIAVPEEKHIRAVHQLKELLARKKATVKELEKLAGFLNFLSRAIILGRTFTRCMYAKFTGTFEKLKSHHHVKLDREFKSDCQVWLDCLTHQEVCGICRPWVDWENDKVAQIINFYTDASGGIDNGGLGCVYKTHWAVEAWGKRFMLEKKPSIEYLELFALAAGLLMWSRDTDICNNRVIVHCDNMSVVGMINNMTSSCKNCMFLLRRIIKDTMVNNYRVFAVHLRSEENDLADALSRNQMDRFWKLCQEKNIKRDRCASRVPDEIWPPAKIWVD